jgi:hypothetical protein
MIAVGPADELRRRAFGGDVVEITTAEPVHDATLGALGRVPTVVGKPVRTDDTTIRATVADAGRALPELLTALRDQDVDVVSSNEANPEYDDVFVRLVEQDRAARASDGGDR